MESLIESKGLVLFCSAAMLALLACATPPPSTIPLPASEAPDVKVVTLDEAMNRTLIRPMPLNIAIPEAYKLFPDEPYPGNHLWTTQKNYDALQKNGTSDRSEGALQLRISMDIGYDRASDSFICGPGCGEAQLSAKMEEAGFKLSASDRRSVNGVPVWFIEAEPQKGGDALYMAYLGTLIETNAVVLTWGPPMNQARFGNETWAAIKNAIVTSPPDPQWIESTTRGDRRLVSQRRRRKMRENAIRNTRA